LNVYLLELYIGIHSVPRSKHNPPRL